MAKSTAQERRAAARKRRRGSVEEEATEAIESDPADALRTAASAAIAGAAVGAARALARRRQEGERDEETAEEPQVEPDPEEPSEPAAAADEETDEGRGDEEPPEPMAAGDARRIVQRAREELRELHGADAESVSAIRRTANGWRVSLEVVEVHRIPESTDVLATYEVEVDGNGDLLTFERTTRYHRSEADRR